jgi:hypothetical protein
VAKFSPGAVYSIKLSATGDIEYSWGNQNGSVIGATARVEQSGSERIFRDTRQAFITIEGPHVSISQGLGSKSRIHVQAARQFAAKVNRLSQQLAAKEAPSQPASGRQGQESIPDQIRKLAELHDQGILTDSEFEAKKVELLGRM